MNVVKHIFFDEWRYWYRSRLAATVIFIGVLLTLASVLVNTIEMRNANHKRVHMQKASEAHFLEQPDRHPHRMVHFGHYVFRAPMPLSIIDPGVDSYTGTSIFLEGHRQNSAMFADQKQSSGLTQFSSLSPAFLFQVIAPLFLILVGYASISRERETGTLNIMLMQGVKQWHILAGKLFALITCCLLILLPLLLASMWAIAIGESALISFSFVMSYFLYAVIWSALIIWVSTLNERSSASFVSLVILWMVFCVAMPRVASSTAVMIAPAQGKLEADFDMLTQLHKLGDGHNISDPAFTNLKAELLKQHNVEDVSELPLNFRGLVAQYSEKKLTKVLNQFAEIRMQKELMQAEITRNFAWLSPAIAVRSLSMMLAGTNLENHHRFLREAEEVRFDFVQALNKLHQDALDFDTDVNRYKNDQAYKAARVSANNWSLLNTFSFQPDSSESRLNQSSIFVLQLLFWCLVVIGLFNHAIRRVK